MGPTANYYHLAQKSLSAAGGGNYRAESRHRGEKKRGKGTPPSAGLRKVKTYVLAEKGCSAATTGGGEKKKKENTFNTKKAGKKPAYSTFWRQWTEKKKRTRMPARKKKRTSQMAQERKCPVAPAVRKKKRPLKRKAFGEKYVEGATG